MLSTLGYTVTLEEITKIFRQELPGSYHADIDQESSRVEIHYTIEQKDDITEQYTTGFLEFGIKNGPMQTEIEEESFEMNLELGEDPYLELNMSYDQSDREAGEQAIATVEDISCLLNP